MVLKTDLFKIYLDRIQRLDHDVIETTTISRMIFRAYNLGIYTARLHSLRDEVKQNDSINYLPKESLLDFLDGIEKTIETAMEAMEGIDL